MTDYGRKNLLKVVGDDPSEWCQYEQPMAYSYIQKVGDSPPHTKKKMLKLKISSGLLEQRVSQLLGG